MSRLKGRLWPVTTIAIILGMFVLPVFPQDEPPPTTGDTSEVSNNIAEWMKEAEQGDAAAQVNLAGLYHMSQDYKEAIRWFRAAAEQGHSTAQLLLGVMYDSGQGVPQDYIQAHMWFNLAASSGGDEDKEMAAKNRDLITEKMTSEQIAEAQRLAREWKPKSSGSQ